MTKTEVTSGAAFADAIKRDAGIRLWVDLALRARPGINPELMEEITTRAGNSGRSHMIPAIEKWGHLTIAFGENLWIVNDPMEIMLILEVHNGYQALTRRVLGATPSSGSESPSGGPSSSEAGSGPSSGD